MATTTPLPVTAVTCLEDRAHVERSTALTLTAGTQRLLLGPVSPLAVDHTLRTELAAERGTAQVLAARLTRDWTPRPLGPPGAADSPLRHRLHELEAALRQGARRSERLTVRLAVLDQLAADLLREIGEGAGLGEAEPPRWSRELERVAAEQDAQAELLRAQHAELAELGREQYAAQQALEEAESAPRELTAHLELTVLAEQDGPAALTVRHLTPCALWRPAYRAVLADGALRLESDAVLWQATGEDWSGVRLTLSTARSALGGEPPLLREDRLSLRELATEEKRKVEVELREEEISTLGPDSAPSARTGELPGVDDGGEVRVLTAPAPADVPGDGRAHRVPLAGFSTPAGAERVAAPELSPLVSEVVTFRNQAAHPLLAGPVELIRGSGFVGRGELRFTAAGAPAELAFPGTDDIRLVREVEESRGSSGLPGLGQRTVLTRTVRVHLSRLSAPGARDEQALTLRERIPVSEVSAVEVRLRKEACDPAPAELDAEGVVRWNLSLPPSSRRTVTLVYEVTASAKVAGLTV
ncbi:mucoidy inhibitor MuiA family protein [Kitasatospora sp. NBC_01287]|uniref:mucoidy inhibitor MuiA family protein n=1 Tax=Kitasatospora sp. NBC_01287 TaxID=2903573 RepID=UPI00225823A2|nr:mucoidy inhibitor MuiA family protein [Kitasatospora sp. NBC_01287]MCX4745999.1 mucoidy inhibitor MuiA family protein [Kitasatospora sp. NBC_01287]